ncbi:ras guanine nucleotide exchange factor domain-containing protein [Neocallimastix lanati (nom. inval.)]|nr:ras guanine nucleotide exchange factor domain-containing protein [Neocallimastix sp. JGI-2020a]
MDNNSKCLSLIPVSRLKKTWDGIGDKHKKIWKSHENLCDPSKNMKNFRDILENSKPPIVPFLPIYIKDLTFMNDGNESKIDGMINFDKLRMMANRVKDISKLVDYEYENINVDSELQNYISHPMVEGDALLMEKSLKLEPRDTKK